MAPCSLATDGGPESWEKMEYVVGSKRVIYKMEERNRLIAINSRLFEASLGHF